MNPSSPPLQRTVDAVLQTLPPVWDRIRSNLRTAATTKFGITLEQFHVLRHIRQGCRTVGALAEKKQISRSAVSQAVTVLVAKGLVSRHPQGADRRSILLALTARASRVLDANYGENRAWMTDRMAPLAVKELDTVRRAMEVLRRTFTPGDR